jgi:hypothetical protein
LTISVYHGIVKLQGVAASNFHGKVKGDTMAVAVRQRKQTIRELMKGYLTLTEMATKYGLTDGSALRHAIKRKILPAEISGKTYFVTEEDAAHYAEMHLRRRGPKGPRATKASAPDTSG